MERLRKFLLEVKKEINNPEIDRYDCSSKFYRSIIYVCGKYGSDRTYEDAGDYLIEISGFSTVKRCCDKRTFQKLVDDIMLYYDRHNKRMVLNNE